MLYWSQYWKYCLDFVVISNKIWSIQYFCVVVTTAVLSSGHFNIREDRYRIHNLFTKYVQYNHVIETAWWVIFNKKQLISLCVCPFISLEICRSLKLSKSWLSRQQSLFYLYYYLPPLFCQTYPPSNLPSSKFDFIH